MDDSTRLPRPALLTALTTLLTTRLTTLLATLLTTGLLAAVSGLLLVSPAHAAPAVGAAATDSGYFSGRLVDPATGKGVGGAKVKVHRINTDIVLGSAVSGPRGYFRIGGLDPAEEELDVRVNGSAVDHETGWVGCHRNVVASWGAACSWGQGGHLPFRVEHL